MSDLGKFASAVYGESDGYAAVFTKHNGKPHHEWFAWPKQAPQWAAYVREWGPRTNVWVGAHLFRSKERSQGNVVDHRVIHTDIDGEVRQKRAEDLGGVVVRSGRPGHAHVYVMLMDDVTQAEHAALGRLLGHYVRQSGKAEKFEDNTLLRPPETVNHKDEANGATVELVSRNGVVWRLDDLVRKLTMGPIRDALLKADTARDGDPAWNRHKAIMGLAGAIKDAGLTMDVAALLIGTHPVLVTKEGWEKNLPSLWNKLATREPEAPVPTADEFWSARPVLQHVFRFAHARMVSPWALLGVVLLRQLSACPPHVALPPLIGGGVGSLNLFCALVGPSGAGKDAAISAAADCVHLGEPAFEVNVGSGEGLVHMYRRKPEKGEEPDIDGFVERQNTVFFVTPEVDGFSALMKRDSATLSSILRSGFNGGQMGFAYANADKRPQVPAHTYRMTWVVGVQPDRSEVLLRQDSGGLPQRFLWLPATDPTISADSVEPDTRMVGTVNFPRVPTVVDVPPEVARLIRDTHAARARGDGDALDGHSLFVREKVAYALACLDQRRDGFTLEDWELAGVVMSVSDATRERCRAALSAGAAAANRARGRADGEREEAKEDLRWERCRTNVLAFLKRNPDGRTARECKKQVRADLRESVDGVLDELKEAGLADCRKENRKTQTVIVWVART